MPELPDVTVYVEALEARLLGARLASIRLASPFLLRSVDPPLSAAGGRTVRGLRRLGKRIVVVLDDGLFLVIHLMIAGRLHWKAAGARAGGRHVLATFEFSSGTLVMTEAGTTRRASLQLVRGEDALRALDPGGLEVLEADLGAFRAALARENHTLKRALTDPTIFSGIGNAYSDEILHRARLSPIKQTGQLAGEEIVRLREATRATLHDWIARLREEAAGEFPEGVTAFREGMAVHGRFGKPCPDCGAPVQRIVYAENETNYCPRCQTDGKLLADRSLSRLLRGVPRLPSADAAVYHPPAMPTPRFTPPTVVLLVRHGQTATTGKRLPGQAPGLHLADAGRRQAEAAAARIAKLGAVAAVYASPLERARETAAPIARERRLPVRVERDLADLDMGDWTGVSLAKVRRRPEWSLIQRYPSGFRFPGGESFTEMQFRMVSALDRLVTRHPGGVVVVVSHADPIKAAVTHALGTHLDLFQRIAIAPGSITAIAYRREGPAVLTVNSVAGDLAALGVT